MLGASKNSFLLVAQRILEEDRRQHFGAVTPMKLVKLIYIAQGYMLATHRKPLFQEAIEAWQYGPMIPRLYRSIRSFRDSPVTCVPGSEGLTLPDEEEEIKTTWNCD